jgi:hypothetical protein
MKHVSNSLTKPNRQCLALIGGYLSPTYSDLFTDCCVRTVLQSHFEFNKPYIRQYFFSQSKGWSGRFLDSMIRLGFDGILISLTYIPSMISKEP